MIRASLVAGVQGLDQGPLRGAIAGRRRKREFEERLENRELELGTLTGTYRARLGDVMSCGPSDCRRSELHSTAVVVSGGSCM